MFTVAPAIPLTVTFNLSDSLLFNNALNVVFLPISKSTFNIVIVESSLSFTTIIPALGTAAVYESSPV